MKNEITFILSALLLLITACSEEHVFYNTAAKAGIVAESEYEVGIPITFADNSIPTQGTTIVSYLWEFGDEDKSISKEKNPTFTYKKDGTFSVKLTVTDSNQLCSTSQHNVTIINPTKADFEVEKSEYYLGDEVKFIDKSITKGSTTIVSYLWEFADADNSTSGEQSPTFKYSEAGSYPVKLTVTDSYGLTVSITRSVNIQDPTKVIATQWTAFIGGAVKGGSSPVLSPDGSTVYALRSLAGSDAAALIAWNTVS
ncbi:PKD domain-containing protein [Phocaeicola sartorii]|uniref:PKD domain-containing protein n=1 Tax=Phocaeicola sartorii TaxID=671267 RepID=UPI002597CF24|nr:PKD domain-containing protein [Phocaeicola sartorii]